MKTDLFQSCGHCWVIQICWHIECSTFTASSFRIWNSSTGIPSPPLALFVVILPKAHLTSFYWCIIIHRNLSWSFVFLCVCCNFFFISGLIGTFYFYWSFWLKVYQFVYLFRNQIFSFTDLFYWFSYSLFHLFQLWLLYFFAFTNLGFCFFFSFSLFPYGLQDLFPQLGIVPSTISVKVWNPNH